MTKAKPANKAATKGAANEPESKLTNLQDNSVTAGEMSAMRGTATGDAKGTSKLAATEADAATFEAEDEKRREDEDNSDYGRLSRSGYVLNEDKVTGKRWIGVPVARDPVELAKDHVVVVTPIAEVRPWTGLTVRPENGEPFAVPEVPKDATPAYWLGLIIPGTKDNFISA